ncbi:hypothetical protein EDC01DRAFT_788103 [Geopyxis carbonaria]|nr:hypothetical protein EDC01DRAFT_788103 [Geopyxis carbonaria]
MLQYNPSSAPALLPTSPTTRGAMSAVSPNPFGAPPPPQSFAMPNIQLQDDDDDILMDYEDDVPPEATNGTEDMVMDIEFENGLKAPVEEGDLMDAEKVHVRGVDNLSTNLVKAWAREHFAEEMETLEWIDDTSCNLVYATPAMAKRSLEALGQPTADPLSMLTLRPGKPFSQSVDSRLQVRIARPTDRKERGARDRSRYYLFHPEEDRAEKFERNNRDRRPHGRRRSTSDDGERGNYSRRHYDARENDSRRRNNEFGEDFYDDDSGARDRQQPARRRSTRSRSRPTYRDRRRSPSRTRSRDRSFSPDRRRRPARRNRSRSPVELFPDRNNRGRELFPEKASASSKELFPQKTSAQQDLFADRAHGTAVMDSYRAPAPAVSPPTRELFPDRASAPRELFPERSSTPKELFPQKLSGGAATSTASTANHRPVPLAQRITLPPKSLAERITGGPAPDSGGGHGLRIRGQSSRNSANGGGGELAGASDDLFAAKMMGAKGVGLFGEDEWNGNGGGGGGGGGRNRRRNGGGGGRRSKAEDHFG